MHSRPLHLWAPPLRTWGSLSQNLAACSRPGGVSWNNTCYRYCASLLADFSLLCVSQHGRLVHNCGRVYPFDSCFAQWLLIGLHPHYRSISRSLTALKLHLGGTLNLIEQFTSWLLEHAAVRRLRRELHHPNHLVHFAMAGCFAEHLNARCSESRVARVLRLSITSLQQLQHCLNISRELHVTVVGKNP